MPRPPKYPVVPHTPLFEARWRIDGVGTLRVERGSPQFLRRANAEWLGLEADDAPGAFWNFYELAEERPERFVVLGEDERILAVWLDHSRLVCGNAYRLDYFKVRPDKKGLGLGRFTFGLIGLRALELKAERIVFQSLLTSEAFYRSEKIGATDCPDWKGGGVGPNLQVEIAALKRLERILDGYRIEK